MDQKTGGELGVEKITLVSLLTLPNMELSHQPLSLKNSGPESKLLVTIRLRVFDFVVILLKEIYINQRHVFSGNGSRATHGRKRNCYGDRGFGERYTKLATPEHQ